MKAISNFFLLRYLYLKVLEKICVIAMFDAGGLIKKRNAVKSCTRGKKVTKFVNSEWWRAP